MSAVEDVIAERARQVMEKGWSPEHDDQHVKGELARAGAAYALDAGAARVVHLDLVRSIWPFDWSAFKPNEERRALVKGCALLLAEIERIDRETARRRRA